MAFEEETVDTTGTDTQTSADADLLGGDTQAGTDTQTVDADQQGEQSTDTDEETTPTDQDTPTGTEETKKQAHQTTEAERFEQLRKERDDDRRRLAELEEKINKPPEPEFFNEQVENTVKVNITKASARIAEIQMFANSSPDEVTPELADELINLQNWIDEAKTALKANVTARTESTKKATEAAQLSESDKKFQVEHQAKMEATIKLMADQDKVPEALVTQARAFIAEEFGKNPLFAQEAGEILERQGYVAHVKFCMEHAKTNMGKAATALQQKKEAAKTAHPGGATVAGQTKGKDYKTMTDEEFEAEMSRVKFGT